MKANTRAQVVEQVTGLQKTVRVMQVGTRRLSLAMYRQIPESDFLLLEHDSIEISPRIELRGEVLGWVNYHPARQGCESLPGQAPDHYHIIWEQSDGVLQKSRVNRSPWSSAWKKFAAWHIYTEYVCEYLVRHKVRRGLTRRGGRSYNLHFRAKAFGGCDVSLPIYPSLWERGQVQVVFGLVGERSFEHKLSPVAAGADFAKEYDAGYQWIRPENTIERMEDLLGYQSGIDRNWELRIREIEAMSQIYIAT